MNSKYLMLVGMVIIATVIIAVAGSSTLMAEQGGQGNCSAGACEKFEGTGPFTVLAAEGMVVSQVWIKTGMATGGCLPFTEDTSACYAISGIGTGSVSVSKLGSGSECQDISHIEVCYKAASTSPEENPPTDVGGETEGPTTGVTPTPVVGGVTATPVAGTTVAGTTTTGSLPVTGLGLLAPLAGAGMAATGYWLSRRRG